MTKGIYECINCGHREVLERSDPMLPGACPKCGGDMILVGFEVEVEEGPAETLETKLGEFYELGGLLESQNNVYAFEVLAIKEDNFEKVLRELEGLGYWAALKKRDGKVVLYVFPAQEIGGKENPIIGVLLFLLTLASTFFAGYALSLNYVAALREFGLPGIENVYLNALAFSISIMAILGTHEMGHKIASALHGVKSTFPYFIPFPSFIGTLGAVIRVKSPIPTRNAAVDLGASGPIAGLLVAIPVTLIGLKLSLQVPVEAITSEKGTIIFGNSILFMLLMKATLDVPQGYGLILHPVAIAGWVGIFVTFLNLIPAAQLDGGHIARAFLPEKAHRGLTYAIAIGTLFLSYFWPGWLLWGLLILFMGRVGNPGALDEVSPLTLGRKILAIIVTVIFIASAIPIPFSFID
ncbi:site-2 protease family protein [Pyrococcus yayanosii]|uniref:Metalloprotease n=1 Tax=Pyrococcus yayanosii (strain CH1 / JCM 16557) TaxID=529709 RepID=F8AG01_PYRYC|nr:site-2 protease family protein [Pyrococcus yayanosii]AEH25055.1 metalloprotease [Pyrococcus yayanosii CH1]